MAQMPGMSMVPIKGTVRPAAVLTPFTDAMPRLADAVPTATTADADYYTINVQQSTAAIAPGALTSILSYGGGFIGPTIRATRNRRVVAKFTNSLTESVVVHLHGGHTPAASDGFPTDEIVAGGTKVNTYPNTQRAATLWYHDHLHMMEAPHVYQGLHGMYIIRDPWEDGLRLPSGRYDVPILLRDAYLNDDNSLLYDPFLDWTVVLANGKPRPYFPVAPRKYRFRFLNGSNHRAFSLTLSDGRPVVQIASDGGLLAAPVSTASIEISSAERAEVVIDFSGCAHGTQLFLQDATLGQVLRFDVTESCGADLSQVPAQLAASLPPLPAANRTRSIELSLTPDGNYFPINGQIFDPDRVDSRIALGSTEIWTITDVSGWEHNFHLHLVQFRILDVNGLAPDPTQRGWKDTVVIPKNGVVRIQASFTDYPGKYVYHCHLLEHASYTGMMATMVVA
ncbi:multicopper oxidase family protein [Catenulispora yoronensis]